MNQKEEKDELKAEIDRGDFIRAAFVAESLGLTEGEIQELRVKALWQMSAEYRNAQGTRRLTQEFGFSKNELKQILDECAKEIRDGGNEKPLRPRYDIRSGKYLSFEEWLDNVIKNWEKLAGL
jgi:hypothetical protein